MCVLRLLQLALHRSSRQNSNRTEAVVSSKSQRVDGEEKCSRAFARRHNSSTLSHTSRQTKDPSKAIDTVHKNIFNRYTCTRLLLSSLLLFQISVHLSLYSNFILLFLCPFSNARGTSVTQSHVSMNSFLSLLSSFIFLLLASRHAQSFDL